MKYFSLFNILSLFLCFCLFFIIRSTTGIITFTNNTAVNDNFDYIGKVENVTVNNDSLVTGEEYDSIEVFDDLLFGEYYDYGVNDTMDYTHDEHKIVSDILDLSKEETDEDLRMFETSEEITEARDIFADDLHKIPIYSRVRRCYKLNKNYNGNERNVTSENENKSWYYSSKCDQRYRNFRMKVEDTKYNKNISSNGVWEIGKTNRTDLVKSIETCEIINYTNDSGTIKHVFYTATQNSNIVKYRIRTRRPRYKGDIFRIDYLVHKCMTIYQMCCKKGLLFYDGFDLLLIYKKQMMILGPSAEFTDIIQMDLDRLFSLINLSKTERHLRKAKKCLCTLYKNYQIYLLFPHILNITAIEKEYLNCQNFKKSRQIRNLLLYKLEDLQALKAIDLI